MKGQEHLLYRFGGHPFAAGLSLPVENLPLFTAAINQQLRQEGGTAIAPAIVADLIVTVSELGKDLFQEIKLLEPCGIGNPVPRLLVQNCWFDKLRNTKIRDRRGQKIEYIKTEFELWDESCQNGFPGIWWGHYRDDFPKERCDALVELDFNAYDRRYEVRMIALRPHMALVTLETQVQESWILDWRQGQEAGWQSVKERGSAAAWNTPLSPAPVYASAPAPLILATPPATFTELQLWIRRAWQEQRSLAIAFTPLPTPPPMDIWQQLVGIAKYLSRTGKPATRQQWLEKLGIGDRTLQQGFQTLTHLGFELKSSEVGIQVQTTAIAPSEPAQPELMSAVRQFLLAVQEEHFRRQYFAQLPLSTLEAIAAQVIAELS
ncbi:MAG: hypothetical protein NW220_07655 [Leptolyngbyaceae cyanobacterium bins.349]|nr:hypothetical protein [Leptolyngbyaceae cyanobacterium bins.349]